MNLRRAGYECVWAADGEKAADLMGSGKYDLLLLDVMLPGINGYELMEYARTLEEMFLKNIVNHTMFHDDTVVSFLY